jgi:hypothetical protein
VLSGALAIAIGVAGHTPTPPIRAPAAQEDGQDGSADSGDEDEDTRALDSINIPSAPAKLAPVARTTNPGGGGRPRQHTKLPGSTAAHVRPLLSTPICLGHRAHQGQAPPSVDALPSSYVPKSV